jgi:hypothetical protein
MSRSGENAVRFRHGRRVERRISHAKVRYSRMLPRGILKEKASTRKIIAISNAAPWDMLGFLPLTAVL